ncbi:hypothetical protein HZC09_03660 [Candidatus Micrarchaeota archaeon]|nr:hypothetical protein [Candidatus Micrarchaeota archaeon]
MALKYTKAFRKHFGALPAFTMRDVRVFFGKPLSGKYSELLLHNFLKRGEVHRIAKGAYSFGAEMQVVGLAFQPYYYGLQDALSLRDLWTQETNPVVITPRKVRTGVRTFLGNNYLVKRIARRMFFGFEPLRYHDSWVNVSDAEKTLIDFVYFRQRVDAEALAELKQNINAKKLSSYLKKCPLWVVKRVKKLLAE